MKHREYFMEIRIHFVFELAILSP